MVGRLKKFSLICSDAGAEPKKSDGMFDVFYSDGVCGVL